MRSFQYTSKDVDEAVKVVGQNVIVEINYTDASSLVLYVQNGINPTTLSEITDANGTNVTRFTADGDGSEVINISGLTPGSFVALGTSSGTGTATANILTGAQ